MKNNRILIFQPGRNGDILICLPIAKHFADRGRDVYWLCPRLYHINFRNINYCHPVFEFSTDYEEIIDISFGLNVHGPVHKWWVENRDSWDSFISAKYHLAKVPLDLRWGLTWTRNLQRETSLLDKIIKQYGADYNIAHETTHDAHVDIDVENKVLFQPIEDYNIFDWYQVIVQARSIHAQDSSLANFVEVLPEIQSKPKYLHHTHHRDQIWGRSILVNNWKFIGGE